MNWEAEKSDWPLSGCSRFVQQGSRCWHIQETGEGPVVLFLHGAAASAHSFAGLLPLLADEYRCIALDLPGHGFSDAAPSFRSGLERVAEDITRLLAIEDITPEAIIGHSAGAAIALGLAARKAFPACPVVSLNGAFSEFEGIAGVVFPALAKLLSINPVAPVLFSATTTERNVAQLLSSTGSQMTPAQTRLYYRLIRDRSHVSGVLSMMAAWDLRSLARQMPEIDCPCLLLVGSHDRVVDPKVSKIAAERLPDARVQSMSRLGHLMHEEDPQAIADLTKDFLAARLQD